MNGEISTSTDSSLSFVACISDDELLQSICSRHLACVSARLAMSSSSEAVTAPPPA